MGIVNLGDNLHEMWKPIFFGENKKNIINLLSAEHIKGMLLMSTCLLGEIRKISIQFCWKKNKQDKWLMALIMDGFFKN